MACGDGGTTEPATPPNQAPAASGSLPALTVTAGQTAEVNVAGYFTDPDGNALTYSATSSNAAIVAVSVAGSVATVTAVAPGVATITVTARDPGGLAARLTFTVTVPNRGPVAAGAVPARTLFVGDTVSVDVSGHFSDPDGDALAYSAASSNAAVVSVSVAGSVVSVAAVAPGEAMVAVTARDPGGLSAQQDFAVTVPNRAPAVADAILAQTLFTGDTASVDVSAHFTDPDGDALTYSAASSDAAVVSASVDGSVVSVAAVAPGETTIAVTATDPGGLSVRQDLAVTVPNRAPAAVGAIPAQTILALDTVSMDVSDHFADPDGDALTYAASSSNAAVVLAVAAGSEIAIVALSPGTATVTITASDPGGLSAQQSFAVTVPNRAPVAVGTIPEQTVTVGERVSVDMSAYFNDPDGDALTHTAASSNIGVATVAVAGDAVTVVGVATGAVIVTVTATDPGGISVQQRFTVTVEKRQFAPVVVAAIPDLTVGLGERRAWTGTDHFTDPDGDPLTYAAGSSNAAVVLAEASGSGFSIAALSAGTATVTVTASDSGGRSASLSFSVTVTQAAGLAIMRTEPAVLVEGASARIIGSGFAATAAGNRVSLGGVAARVASASATSLTITVPRSDCLPPRRTELRVQVENRNATRTVGLTPRSREDLDLSAGQYRYTPAGNGCLHLPGGDYMIGVVSTSQNAASLTSVSMAGAPGDATVLATATADARTRPHVRREAAVELFPAGVAPMLASVPDAAGDIAPRQDTTGLRRDGERHARIMAANLEMLRRLGVPPSAPPTRFRSRTVSQGDTIGLFADPSVSCSSKTQVQAEVRLIGNNTVWLEDVGNPAGGFTDSELAGLDSLYASDVKPVHDAYFGGLSDVDGDGRLWILMTKEVNREDGENTFLGGWVWFADLFPSTSCATSNHREIFYGRVPDPAGTFGHAYTKQRALDYYPSLLTHEITHLVQGNALVFGGARSATWEIEGGATLAEQLVAYRRFGHGSGREMGYAEFQQGSAWYNEWVVGLARFFGYSQSGRVANAPEQCSWVGTPEQGNNGPCEALFRAVYDVPSVLYRYALDRWGGGYPGGETALMRRLTQSPREGFAALEDASSWRIEDILADFYLALWLDLNGGRAFGMTTWDLQNIWNRLVSDAQLVPHTSSSVRFSRRWSIRAGSTSYLHWTPTGSRVPAAIKVTSTGGGATPGNISVWAYRIR